MLVSACACAGSGTARQANLDRAFARIQVHEADIEHDRALAAGEEATCDARCAAGASALSHGRRLCEIARAAADADALERCERASRSADMIAASAGVHCHCERD